VDLHDGAYFAIEIRFTDEPASRLPSANPREKLTIVPAPESAKAKQLLGRGSITMAMWALDQVRFQLLRTMRLVQEDL
jgi:hypothetical protein